MGVTNYRLRSRSDKNVSIYIVLSLGRGKKYETVTGFYINPKDWKENIKNSSKQFGFPKNSKLAEIKNIKSDLIKLSGFIDRSINTAQGKGDFIDTNWLKSQINICFKRNTDIDKKTNLLTDYIQNIIENADTKVLQGGKIGLSKNRVKGYITFKGVIERYQKHIKKELFFKDLDINFEEDFRNWLIKKQRYSINYAGKNFDNLKAVCNDAIRVGREVNPHVKNILSFSEDKDEREVIRLTFDELEKIENTILTNESLINVRKWLLLGCEIGQRGGDLLNLTESSFITRNGGTYIDIRQQKTDKNVTLRVNPKIEKILKSGFPYKISIQKLNDYLKNLCEIAELDKQIKGKLYSKKEKRKIKGIYPKYKLITSHTFRRSFSSNYYKLIPTSILKEITGHSKEELFLAYIGESEDKDANADLMFEYFDIIEQKRKEQ